jgi:Fe-S cluster assembly protein SufB
VVFANAGQVADTGAKVIHIGKRTSSRVLSKSLSKGGGVSVYRGLLDIKPSAIDAVSEIACDALLLDAFSKNDTIPDIRVGTATATVAHEATAGRIGTEEIFYLRSRGFSDAEARTMIVS